ncbi:uncharacterized protein L199_001345 [Kwoniella botswanensis]|uniref:uncharacterized protein n=1 Tax=Kwoniella botswanensis TaxID=1268659 RepID=UPI00315CE4AD
MSRHNRTSIDETIPSSEWQVDFDNTTCADLALSTYTQADSFNLSENINPCTTSDSMISRGGTSLSGSRVKNKTQRWAHENKKTRDKKYHQQTEEKEEVGTIFVKVTILNLEKDKSDRENINIHLINERDLISSTSIQSELSSQATIENLVIVNKSVSTTCAELEVENRRLRNTIQWYGFDCSNMIDTLKSISKNFQMSVQEQDKRTQSRIEYLESLARELQK